MGYGTRQGAHVGGGVALLKQFNVEAARTVFGCRKARHHQAPAEWCVASEKGWPHAWDTVVKKGDRGCHDGLGYKALSRINLNNR